MHVNVGVVSRGCLMCTSQMLAGIHVWMVCVRQHHLVGTHWYNLIAQKWQGLQGDLSSSKIEILFTYTHSNSVSIKLILYPCPTSNSPIIPFCEAINSPWIPCMFQDWTNEFLHCIHPTFCGGKHLFVVPTKINYVENLQFQKISHHFFETPFLKSREGVEPITTHASSKDHHKYSHFVPKVCTIGLQIVHSRNMVFMYSDCNMYRTPHRRSSPTCVLASNLSLLCCWLFKLLHLWC